MIGFCARTEPRIGDCDAGDQGSFVVRSPNATSQIERCVEFCRGCRRCNWVSVALHNAGECGWFRDCDADNLESNTPGTWRTVAARAPARPLRRFEHLDQRLRSHDVVRWGEEGKDVEGVPVVVADDWGTSWVVGEHHHEAFVKRFVRYGASGCRNGDMLVLDVGANSGYFSMISAALGCRVYAFELQAGCIELLKALVHANGFTNQVAVIHGAVGALGEYAIAPAVGCAGDAFARDKGRGARRTRPFPRWTRKASSRTMTF